MSRQKDKGAAFERRVVGMAHEAGLNARKQPLSGQLLEYPSDAVIEEILIECKAGYTHYDPTGVRYFHLDMNWISKNEAHAKRMGFQSSVLAFRPNGANRVYCVVDLLFFLNILKELKQCKQEGKNL